MVYLTCPIQLYFIKDRMFSGKFSFYQQRTCRITSEVYALFKPNDLS